MRRLFVSLMLTLTAFIVKAQPSAIAPHDYQQMLKKGIDVEWWGRSEKNKYGNYERCKDLSPKVSFDLIVEPSDKVKKDIAELNSLYEDCVAAIRKTNPKRIIFIAPPKLSHPEGLKNLEIPSSGKDYLMAEWHFYAAGPSKSNDKKRWTTGTAEEKQKIKQSIKVAVDWQKKTGIYTWVGAWMPGDYNKGDNYSIKEQIEFASFMTQQLDKYGVPFAINADHQFYDYKAEQWIPKYKDLLNTIFM